MGNNINIILPSFYENYELNSLFIELFQESKTFFYDVINKLSVQGAFPYFLWAADKQNATFSTKEDIIAKTDYFLQKNISVYYDCTNTKLEHNHFYDSFCNLVLKHSNSKQTYIITNNNQLVNYIKLNYSDFKFVEQQNIKNEEEKNIYDYHLINFSNKNKEAFFNNESKDKYVIKLNSYCLNNCNCIDNLSIDKLNFEKQKTFECLNYAKTFNDIKKEDSFINIETMLSLSDNGFSQFIIENNTKDKYELLESYLYYLIKPNYIDEVRLTMLKKAQSVVRNMI